MKILIVDDEASYVARVVEELRKNGLDVNGMVPGSSLITSEGQPLTNNSALALVRSADVIFLDHNMPDKNGQELLEYWQEQGINISAKRVIGISSDYQSYLSERISGMSLNWPKTVKRILGIG